MRAFMLALGLLLGTLPVSHASAQTDLAQMLTAHPWCKTLTEANRNNTSYERAQFRADGSASLVTSTLTSMSMGGMSMASSSWRTDLYRWRLEPGTLWLSRDGIEWTSGSLTLRRDGNEMVLTVDATEYRPCR
mgnify:CR=1 FL=1